MRRRHARQRESAHEEDALDGELHAIIRVYLLQKLEAKLRELLAAAPCDVRAYNAVYDEFAAVAHVLKKDAFRRDPSLRDVGSSKHSPDALRRSTRRTCARY